MSKWGYEEPETIKVINDMNLTGSVLNLAAGDGRFNNALLAIADKVIAADNDQKELDELIKKCPENLTNKLETKIIDITKQFPFENSSFDGIFCTGTLHLFELKDLRKIILEIKRSLKPNGKFIIDFATDIQKVKNNGEIIPYKTKIYETKQAIKLMEDLFKDFNYKIEICTLPEEQLFMDNIPYTFKCNFLLVYGNKK